MASRQSVVNSPATHLVLLAALLWSRPGETGIAVGHPIDLLMNTSNVTYDLVMFHVDELVMGLCGGGEVRVSIDEVLNPIDPTTLQLSSLPPGQTLCSVTLTTAHHIIAHGSDGPANFAAVLDLPSLGCELSGHPVTASASANVYLDLDIPVDELSLAAGTHVIDALHSDYETLLSSTALSCSVN